MSRRRARALVVGWVGTLWAAATPTHAAPPVVAVFGLENHQTALTASELARLTDYLGAALTESGRFQVVPTSELRRAIDAQKAESYRSCYSESCQIEIGKEVAASKSLAGSVSRLGQKCLVTLVLYDLARATQETAGTARGGCSVDEILASLDQALAKLTGRSDGAEPAAVAGVEAARVIPGPRDAGAEDARVAPIARDAEPARTAREAPIARDAEPARSTDGRPDAQPSAPLEPPPPLDMITIPAGPAWIGCDPKLDGPCPKGAVRRRVNVRAFRIDRTEVTVAAYRTCVAAGRCPTPARMPEWAGTNVGGARSECNWGQADRDDHPVNCLHYFHADAYCVWRGQRIPSHVEWEKAARGEARARPTGVYANLADVAHLQHFAANAATWRGQERYDDGFALTAPVGRFPSGASSYGLLDVMGNVAEWTRNHEEPYDWLVHGGSHVSPPAEARVSSTIAANGDLSSWTGFRCAMNAAP